MTFRADRFAVFRGIVEKPLLRYLQIVCDMTERVRLMEKPPTPDNPFPYGDDQIPNSLSEYGTIFGDSLITMLKEKFSYVAGTNLVEAYSYWRTYYAGAILSPHRDRESCEFTASVCIQKGSCDWPIYIKSFDRKVSSVELEEGDAVFFQGGMLEHWRDEYKGNHQKQIFLHYVADTGPYKNFKYDRRPVLGFVEGKHV